jgi:hypothetical protein
LTELGKYLRRDIYGKKAYGISDEDPLDIIKHFKDDD